MLSSGVDYEIVFQKRFGVSLFVIVEVFYSYRDVTSMSTSILQYFNFSSQVSSVL